MPLLESVQAAIDGGELRRVLETSAEWQSSARQARAAVVQQGADLADDTFRKVCVARAAARLLLGEYASAVEELGDERDAGGDERLDVNARRELFCRAYAAYRQQRLDEALLLLERSVEERSSVRGRLLRAQIAYGRGGDGDYEHAAALFRNALGGGGGGSGATTVAASEAMTNHLAALAMCREAFASAEAARAHIDDALASAEAEAEAETQPEHELLYNAALLLLAQSGERERALSLLREARAAAVARLGERALDEVAPIDVLTAYVLQVSSSAAGDRAVDDADDARQRARQIYRAVLASDAAPRGEHAVDEMTRLVASINSAVLDNDAARVHRLQPHDKMTPAQRAAVQRNRVVASLLCGDAEAARVELDAFSSATDAHSPGAVGVDEALLRASVLHGQGAHAEAERTLLDWCDSARGDARCRATAAAAMAQLALLRGDLRKAADALERMSSDDDDDGGAEPLSKTRPACVATRVAIYEKLGETERAATLLAEYATKSGDARGTRRYAELLLAQRQYERAVKALRDVSADDDPVLAAYRVMAESHVDVDAAEVDAADAIGMEVEEVAAGVDVERALVEAERDGERGNGNDENVDDAAAMVTSKSSMSSSSQQRRRQRQRQSKRRPGRNPWPKDYDSNAAPDPERWLPKRLRTKGKHKKRRGRGGQQQQQRQQQLQQQQHRDAVGSGTQGATGNGKDAEAIQQQAGALTNSAACATSTSSTTSSASSSASRSDFVPKGTRSKRRKGAGSRRR